MSTQLLTNNCHRLILQGIQKLTYKDIKILVLDFSIRCSSCCPVHKVQTLLQTVYNKKNMSIQASLRCRHYLTSSVLPRQLSVFISSIFRLRRAPKLNYLATGTALFLQASLLFACIRTHQMLVTELYRTLRGDWTFPISPRHPTPQIFYF